MKLIRIKVAANASEKDRRAWCKRLLLLLLLLLENVTG
jgi:hypothetical protein